MGRPPTDKRQRLVKSAAELFHRQGYARTSISDVAKNADVAAGNVFYYFKSKEELASAVVDQWFAKIADYLALFETENDSWLRIERFVVQTNVLSEMYVEIGCPLASLTRDLRREADPLHSEVLKLFSIQHRWLTEQFARLGFSLSEAEQHARFLMAGLQGSIMLAYVHSDKKIIGDSVRSLNDWLHDLQNNC